MAPKEENPAIVGLKQEVERLAALEKQMAKLRAECEQKSLVWEAVKLEIEELEEKAVIYKYKVAATQENDAD